MADWDALSAEEKAAAVRAAIAAGAKTATEISIELLISRNAVIGLCHRAGIPLPSTGKSGRPRATGPGIREQPQPKEIRRSRGPSPANLANKRESRKRDPGPPVTPAREEPILQRAELDSGLDGVGVLFIGRSLGQCAWPIDAAGARWESTPAERKRCCGRPVREGARNQFCAGHLLIATTSRAPVTDRDAA